MRTAPPAGVCHWTSTHRSWVDMSSGWSIMVLPQALAQLAAISDQRAQRQLRTTLHRQAQDPNKIGKPLRGDLAGFRSIRAVGQRSRIIQRVVAEQVIVYPIAVGCVRKAADAMSMP